MNDYEKMHVKTIILIFFLCLINTTFCQKKKQISSEFLISPLMIDFGSKISNKKVDSLISIGYKISYSRRFEKGFGIGLTTSFTNKDIPEGFNYNSFDDFDQFIDKIRPYHTAYYFGIDFSQDFKMKRNFSLTPKISFGINYNTFGVLKLPVNKNVIPEFDFAVFKKDKKGINIGYFFSPNIELRKDYGGLFLYLSAGYIFRNCSTNMLFLGISGEDQIYSENKYVNKIDYSAFNAHFGLGFSW